MSVTRHFWRIDGSDLQAQGADGRTDAALELALLARAILDVNDDTVVSIGEHDCGEPGCCGPRTVVLVLRARHPTKAIEIKKPLKSVTHGDLSEALAPLAALACAPEAPSRTTRASRIPLDIEASLPDPTSSETCP